MRSTTAAPGEGRGQGTSVKNCLAPDPPPPAESQQTPKTFFANYQKLLRVEHSLQVSHGILAQHQVRSLDDVVHVGPLDQTTKIGQTGKERRVDARGGRKGEGKEIGKR